MHVLGVGTMREMRSVMSGIFLRSWRFREYTLSEKINLWRGKLLAKGIMWDEMVATDLTEVVTRVDVPVYFFHGAYDYTVSYPLAKAYLAQLQAPVKRFYTFDQSAHSPIFEEPDRMRAILREDALAGATHLADQR